MTDELAAARKRIEDLETCALRRRSENLVLKKQIESLRDDNENLRVRMLARLDPFKQGERQGLLDRVKVLEEQNKCLLAEAEQKRWRHMDSEALLDRINQLEAHNSQLKCRTEDMALSMGKMSERIGELLDALRAARASTLETMSILRKPTPNDP